MLRWASNETKALTELLDYMFETQIDSITEAIEYQRIVKKGSLMLDICDEELALFESPQLLLETLKELKAAHESKELYMPTDWHFFILDRLLEGSCSYLNDMSPCDYSEYSDKDLPAYLTTKKRILKKAYTHDYLCESIFWDLDHDIYLNIYKERPKFTKGCEELKLELHK
jgi:hypothetical protein